MNYDNEITEIRQKLGKRLLILAHHYQRDEIVRHADKRGDSFELAKYASEQNEAEFIVFCGVRFMVEAAEVLSKKHQKVFHPNKESGCPLADKADIPDVIKAWEYISTITDINSVIPVVYVNSTIELKSFCGFHGGLTCTSSNADKAFKWGFLC